MRHRTTPRVPPECRVAISALVMLPFALLLANSEWMFSPPGTIDPWFYTGFFMNPRLLESLFGSTYYAGRLPWILPGALAHAVLSPLEANYVLHLTFYGLAVGALCLALAELHNLRTGLFTAVLMGGYSHVLGAIGWDYIDGAGVTYFLLTFWLLTRAARRAAWRIPLLLAGATFALLAYCNLFWIVFAPLLALHYFTLATRAPSRRLNESALLVGAGFLSVTALLSLASWLLGGPVVFFFASLRSGAEILVRPNQWRKDLLTWLPDAGWLLVPLATALWVAPKTIDGLRRFGKLGAENRTAVILQTEFLAACMLMGLTECMGIPVLQLSYYATYLIPLTFVALGSMVMRPVVALSPRGFAALTVGAVCLLVLPFVVEHAVPAMRPTWVAAAALVGLLVLGGVAARASDRSYARLVALGILVAALSAVSYATALPAQFGFGRTDTDIKTGSYLFARTDRPSNRATFLAVVQAVAAVRTSVPGFIPAFWYDAKAEFGGVQCAVASAYLWSFRLINDALPRLESADLQKVAARRFIAVMSADDAVIEQARATLVSRGFRATRASETTISEGPVRFKIVFFRLGA